MGLSRKQIEERAQELLERGFGPDAGAPVDVEQLVSGLGGAIEVRFDSHRNTESLHVDADGTFTVFVSPNTSMLRDRFTIAHELGHYVLHHQPSDGPKSFQRFGRSTQETEANAFAGALLMPEDLFRSAWERHGGSLPLVARDLLVSHSAADVRSQVLGLAR